MVPAALEIARTLSKTPLLGSGESLTVTSGFSGTLGNVILGKKFGSRRNLGQENQGWHFFVVTLVYVNVA